MERWEKVAAAAGVAGLLWVFWYDHLACPLCKAEANRKAGARIFERHAEHGKQGEKS